MNTGEKLHLLLATCKCGITIQVNDHREVYETAEQRLAEYESRGEGFKPDITDDVRAKMIKTDTIISIHFYPKHPVSFYEVWHYDLDAALDDSLECLRQEGMLTAPSATDRDPAS